MRLSRRSKLKTTDGERARALAFFIVGLGSAALGFLAVLHLDRDALFQGLGWYQIWIIVASGLGGLSALFLSGDRMGQTGPIGSLRAVAGGVWVTFVGSLIGGTFGLPLYGTMFGPFIVSVTFASAPLLLVLWSLNLFGAHMLLKIYQTERDSIFSPARMTTPDHPNSLSVRLRGRFV